MKPQPQPHIVECILLKPELLHDIQADITRIEKSRNLQASPILTNEEADSYILNRYIDEAVGKALSHMQAYLMLPSTHAHHIANNHTSDWQEKSITLAMPANWPPHNIDPLRDAIHTYVVKFTEYKLLATALTDDRYTALCLDEANSAYDSINSLISSRLGPQRIHPSPFG